MRKKYKGRVHRAESLEDMINVSRGGEIVDLPSEPNYDNPMYLFIGRPTLELILADNIEAIRGNLARGEIGQADEDREASEQLMKDREKFLAWVRANPNVNIFVGLFPEAEYPDPGQDQD